MKEIILKVPEEGTDGMWELRDQLSAFVESNFRLLYEGACRMSKNIEDDYYAPKRVQINRTRLHETVDLKYADGHKWNEDCAPSEEQLRNTIKDLQNLLDSAGANIPAPFMIKIIRNIK